MQEMPSNPAIAVLAVESLKQEVSDKGSQFTKMQDRPNRGQVCPAFFYLVE